MTEIVVLVNPHAGSGRAVAVWERARAAVPAAAAARVVLAGDPASAAAQLDELLGAEPPPERLIAVGGDGTVHLAANRLVADGLAGRVALGMVPGGTGSDLARTLGLPRRPAAALAHALAAEPRPIDLLRVTSGGDRRVVLNVASAGISGLVATRINAMPVKGRLVYLTAALRAVAAYRPFVARVTVDGKLFYDGGVYLVAVANGPTFGKGMKVAPRAEIADGVADVVVVRAIPPWRVPFELPRLYLGNLLASRAVTWRRGVRVEIEPEAGPAGALPPLEIDGETLPGAAAEIEVLPGALRFVA